MKLHRFIALTACASALCTAGWVQAQSIGASGGASAGGNAGGSVRAVPSGAGAGAGTMGAAPASAAPNPAGLPSVLPNPGGLTSPNAAGLPSPNPINLSSPGATAPGTSPGGSTAPGSAVANPDTANVIQPGADPNALQGRVAAGGAPGPAQNTPAGGSGYSALQLAQSFRAADANLNGELTRAEAQRLTIMPSSFEEMDRNKDGILSRSEYEDGVR